MNKNVETNLATNVGVNPGYSGKLAGDLFIQSFKDSDTIKQGLISVIPNALGTGFLPRMQYSAGLTNYKPGFESTGDVQYINKEVLVKRYKIDHEIEKEPFVNTFEAESQGLFGARPEIPTTLQQALIDAVLGNLSEEVDNFIWNGKEAEGGNPEYVGLKEQILTDGTVNGFYEGPITKSNITDVLDIAVDKIPSRIKKKDVIIVGSDSFLLKYKQNLASQGLRDTVGDKENDYLGFKIYSVGALEGDTFFLYERRNLGFLTGLTNDMNRVDIADGDTSGDLNGMIKTKVVVTMGVGFSLGSEIVAHDVAFNI